MQCCCSTSSSSNLTRLIYSFSQCKPCDLQRLWYILQSAACSEISDSAYFIESIGSTLSAVTVTFTLHQSTGRPYTKHLVSRVDLGPLQITHLTYRTSTTPRVQQMMTMDGSLERLVKLSQDFCYSPPDPRKPLGN